MDILNTICEFTKKRIEIEKQIIPIDKIKQLAYSLEKGNFSFYKSLQNSNFAFICECKKASPSKGIICDEFNYLQIAKDYELAGANAVSVLTEPKWFLGNDLYLEEISKNIKIPCLRKDFVVDEYMIYQAKILGASAVLLICSILDENKIKHYIEICDKLGLCALVEAHTEEEIKKALRANAKIIGINNRNLKDFSVNVANSIKLRKLVPNEIIFIAESGIKDEKDIKILFDNNINGVLIGETLMKADNKIQKLKDLKKLL